MISILQQKTSLSKLKRFDNQLLELKRTFVELPLTAVDEKKISHRHRTDHHFFPRVVTQSRPVCWLLTHKYGRAQVHGKKKLNFARWLSPQQQYPQLSSGQSMYLKHLLRSMILDASHDQYSEIPQFIRRVLRPMKIDVVSLTIGGEISLNVQLYFCQHYFHPCQTQQNSIRHQR